MVRLFYNFIVHNNHKWLTLKTLILAAVYRSLVFFVPVQKLHPYFGLQGVETGEEPLTDEQRKKVGRVAYRVGRVANRTPWESKCLVRALVAQRLLKSYKLPTTLYLGVGKNDEDKMIAHAWLRCGPLMVTGADGRTYATVAKFAKYPKGWQAETA